MELIALTMLVIFAVSIYIVQIKNHKRKIKEKVHLLGGEVITIERKTFFTGPFFVVRRGRTVYRIEYKKDNSIKVGWVKFGDLSGPDWRI
jgi:hypothetical protein